MDQDKYVEEQDQDQEQEARQNEESQPEEVDDMKYFLELLRHIRLAINSGKSVPLTGKKLIDAEICLDIIDEMKRNLPDAVQYGMKMYSERERIMKDAEKTAIEKVSGAEMRAKAALEQARKEAAQLINDAQDEADAILQNAQERAAHMISENEIVRQAREEARIIKNDARVDATELRLKVNHDAYEMLSSVENELVEACKSVRRKRAELGDDAE